MRRNLLALLGFSLLSSVGCAATSPVLVEPRVPNRGEVRGQIGAAAFAPVGGDANALSDARQSLSTSSGGNATTDRGAAVALAARPGVAPFVRGVVGIAPEVEATLRYGGRDVSAGVRWTFVDNRTENAGATTVSLGGEGRALLLNRLEGGVLDGVDLDTSHGYGGTIPLVAAWQSDAGLVLLYAAALAGFDGVSARLTYSGDTTTSDASIRRFFVASTFGVGIGLRHVHAIFELGVERDWLHAAIASRTNDFGLWSLTPAGCLSLQF